MKDSKLISILKTFSKDEFKEFEKFIGSPFFSTGRNLKPLYIALKKFYPAFNSRNFTRENVFAAMFANRPYNDALMRRHTSDMIKMTEEYIKQIGMRKGSFEVRKMFLYELMTRKIGPLFHHHLKLLEGYIQSQKLNYNYFYRKAGYETIIIDFYLEKDHQEAITGNVIKRSNFQLVQFLSDLSGSLHDIHANHHAFNSDFKDTIIYKTAEAIDFLNLLKNIKDINPLYHIAEMFCYNILSIIHPLNDEYVLKQKNLIEKNLNLFSREFSSSVLAELIGRMQERNSSGKPEFLRLTFDLNKLMLKENLIRFDLENDFPIIGYKTLIRNALRVGEIEWTHNFIEEYHKQLAPGYRTSMKHYGYAHLYFKKKEFNKALEECSMVKFENIIINYDIKMLTLKLYYEMESFETAISSIDSFKHFLNANKFISEKHKEYFKNFVHFVNRLIKAKMYNNENVKGDIINELNKIKLDQSRDWILEKVKELK